MYHRIRDTIMELYIHVVHIKLSLVIEFVLAQLSLICKSADESVPLVMGTAMLI
jgi:hypothetical protein